MEWALMPLRKYADFTGRARRKEYWLYTLLLIVALYAVIFVESMVGLGGMFLTYGALSLLLMLGTLIPSIAVGVRRLHDTGRSGWWMLIALVPLIGGIVLLIFMVLDGTRGPNEYGADPKETGAARTAGVV
jgi:uncharacterized membrane protein YhaH (DUF805 family)